MTTREQIAETASDYADAQMIYSLIAMDRAVLLVADPDQLRRRAATIARASARSGDLWRHIGAPMPGSLRRAHRLRPRLLG